MANYINKPTEALVAELDDLIQGRKDLRTNVAVIGAFDAFKRTSEIPPAIVEYIKRETDASSPNAGLTKEQLELLMFAIIARSSSTYGTIPGVAAHLAVIGEHADAAVINENAKNETGDKAHTPHPTLLYESYKILGEALGTHYPTPASYHIARHIFQAREKMGADSLHDVDSVERYLGEHNLHTPTHTKADVNTAIYFTGLANPEITKYHTQILQTETKMNDSGETPASRNPYDKKWLAVRRLEIATREASSVDEHDTGKLSYIGTWGLVVDSMLGHVSLAQRRKVKEWTDVHNDEAAGQAVGWEGAAEEGHAEDARAQAIKMMKTLDAKTFAETVNEIAVLNQSRLDFWDLTVKEMQSKEHSREKITFNRTDELPALPRPKRKLPKALQWAAGGAVAASMLTAGTRSGSDYVSKQSNAFDGAKTKIVIRGEEYKPRREIVAGELSHAETHAPDTSLFLPGKLYELITKEPEKLNDPQAVSRAAQNVRLRERDGKPLLDEVVFTYVERQEGTIWQGKSEKTHQVTVAQLPEAIDKLRTQLDRTHQAQPFSDKALSWYQAR